MHVSDYEKLQFIYNQLFDLMPDDVKEIHFLFNVFPTTSLTEIFYMDSRGEEQGTVFPDINNQSINSLVDDRLRELQQSSTFTDKQPWTNGHFIVDKLGNLKITLLNIPIENSLFSFSMKGISDLSWEEAQKSPYFVEKKDYKKAIKFMKGKEKPIPIVMELSNFLIEFDAVSQDLGNVMRTMMPENTEFMLFSGVLYPNNQDFLTFVKLNNGNTQVINLPINLNYYNNNLLTQFRNGTKQLCHLSTSECYELLIILINELNQSAMFAKERWTHFGVYLTPQGKYRTQFAYIPIEDYSPGLFLRGISELSEEEVIEFGVPKALWEERKNS